MPKSAASDIRPTLSQKDRLEIVRLYEAGVFNGVQLARRYGVRRDVVYRQLKSSHAVKGRFAKNSVRKLEAELDARQQRRREAKWADENRRLDAFILSGEAVAQLTEALLRADREGNLVAFGRALSAM